MFIISHCQDSLDPLLRTSSSHSVNTNSHLSVAVHDPQPLIPAQTELILVSPDHKLHQPPRKNKPNLDICLNGRVYTVFLQKLDLAEGRRLCLVNPDFGLDGSADEERVDYPFRRLVRLELLRGSVEEA